ncbi:MAG: hypothetical protein A3E21_03480 [Sulfurimonas sp. RIFCSPHIGHO2_12_FULL_36_9]|uniref:hypothetical protein n=1 Tax=Sulfurimonas sp. RIFCSPLOWO2_12_36_12 TaxID=1802253 RepID=UPI0008AE7348|nr:hypothetical protein [Sulfurimonas sp. RIFCSPLOWO2_12_36_12]OHD96796.1 MAG: hypothetical protein A3E21_03480 [Sulfurimonas sp. RIFCSPHIGHO2_12_FULL_36_9]OHD97351.1 MAG: hypothetical protein A3J26_01925 [Sulfurimonas sp. RIFCSPLOWO2_02_FULL_36_28]OHE02712.1 MAG: hypothetical protein A2W82_02250 [Sulfurimonas sp. RIFCSPLOWO2_12_36_12]OHE07578.1 MAG: hypothetical protein A3K14_10455 [Sulfurimonas sp. RIFCSPLOWO2_12_FULL_36_74]
MSSGFEKLKSIGVQKIHEATHISRAHIQGILQENFEDMNSVQLAGFISILEREYSVDLSELKNKAKEHFKNSSHSVKKAKAVNVFLAHKKKKRLTLTYIISGVAFVGLIAIFIISSSSDDVVKVDNSVIESAQSNISVAQSEQNSTVVDKNSTLDEEKLEEPSSSPVPIEVVNPEAAAPKAAIQAPSFKIMPNSKVWMGYIDLATGARNQKIFSDELLLDPAKEWLLFIGHGQMNIEINGVTTSFNNKNSMRFLYKNSELKEIDSKEFKNLNSGKAW